MKAFVCSVCEEKLPASRLSLYSLGLSGTTSRAEACQILPPDSKVCSSCQSQLDVNEEMLDGHLGRTDYERFILSGLHLNRVQREWLALNY